VHNFNNDGSIQVNSGTLNLMIEVTFVNTGYLEAAGGTTVRLQQGEYVFDPNLNDTGTYMLRGAGWFVVDFDGKVTIPQNADVGADNFELADDGILQGLGTFEVGYFKWTGGIQRTSDP